jgi:hypothetical protein
MTPSKNKRVQSHPGCIFTDQFVGEHRTQGLKSWDSDTGPYLQIAIGLDIRKYLFQVNLDEARDLAARLNKFIADNALT